MQLKNTVVFGLALTGLLVGANGASATVINFNDGVDQTSVGSFYAGQGVTFANATFSTEFGLAGGDGLALESTDGAFQPQPTDPIVATFTTSQSSVGITVVDAGENGSILSAYDSSNNLLGTDTFTGTGLGNNEFATLTVNAANISKITFSQLRNISKDGVVFDNLTFSNGATVPEPSSLVTFAFSGLGVAGLMLNRKRRGANA